ncbi:NAD-dependent epimerase/dehydratase family protein [soil metagenome]
MDIRGKHLVLTGGASLIGSYIAEQLLAEGVGQITVADNFSLGSSQQLDHLAGDSRLQVVNCDVLRLDQLLKVMQGAEGVFHVAGYLTLPLSRDLYKGVDVNVRGTHNVLEASHFCGVKKVVLSSSVAVYGNPDGTIGESAPFNRTSVGYSPAAAIYGATKIINEHMAQIYSATYGLEHVALRYASVYGARQHGRAVNALLLTEPLEQIREGRRPVIHGDGSEVHDYVHVKDVANANVVAMKSAVGSGSFTIGTGVSTSCREVVDILLDLFDSSLEPEYSSAKRANSSAVSSSFDFDVSAAREVLGWTAKIGMREGLQDLKRWYESK